VGKVNTIIYNIKLDCPDSNRLFAIRKVGRTIIFYYRNLTFTLPWRVLLQCKEAINEIKIEEMLSYDFSGTNFREIVNYTGLPLIEPEQQVRLIKCGPDNYVIKYRNLQASVEKKVYDVLRNYIECQNGKCLPSPVAIRPLLSRLKVRLVGKKVKLKEVPPLLWQRFSIDLCENIHIHFQNFRLEFSPGEFNGLSESLSTFDWESLSANRDLFHRFDELCAETEWSDRFQLEEQVEGHYHLHYRNLRIEFRTFSEVGLNLPVGDSFGIERAFGDHYQQNYQFRLQGIRSMRLRQLHCAVYTEAGIIEVPIPESPIFRAMSANDPSIYEDYMKIVKRFNHADRHSWSGCLEILDGISKTGYRESKLIVIRGDNNRIDDGQHRACALYFLYGGGHVVKVAQYG